MGFGIPRVITPTSASGSQVIDGSLRFSGDSHLTRTPGSAGNEKTYTFSFWVKPCDVSSNTNYFFTAGSGGVGGVNNMALNFDLYNRLVFGGYKASDYDVENTEAYHRDTGWYHFVTAVDTTQGASANRVKFYVNGIEQSKPTSGSPFAQNSTPFFNSNVPHTIGSSAASDFNGYMSQVYLIDGQALGPESFGYTDPLTNTWRPKKAAISGFNDGTVWSSNSTNFTNPGQGFNGNPTNYAEVSSSAAKGTFTFPKSIQVENNVTFISSSGTAGNLFVNDSSTAMQGTSFQVQTISFSGTLSSISLQSASQPVLYYFSVDGKPLIDSVTNNFGNNGFYLPFDGNALIGKDQSGNNNDWTPVNFDGSTVIPKATGALPILSTQSGGRIATVGVRTDTSSSSLVLALPLVGTNVDVSNQINSGTTTKVMTSVGTAAASTLQSNFYGGSFLFDGNSDYLTTPASSDFNFADGNYTIEWWQWWNSITGYQAAFDCGYTDVDSLLVQTGNGTGKYQVYAQSDTVLEESVAAVVQKWTHYALVRNGTYIKLYRDGAVSGSATHSGSTHGSSTHTFIVASSEGGYEFNGYMQDFRVYKGVAKYTENFIPASTNPDILPETPSGVVYSSQLTKFSEITTDGSVAFDHSGDYLDAGSALVNTSSHFCVEAFLYLDNDAHPSSDMGMICSQYAGGQSGRMLYGVQDNNLVVRINGGTVELETGFILTSHTWYHTAWTWDGTTHRLFLNGVLKDTSTTMPAPYTGTNTLIGGNDALSPDYSLGGYLSNFRIVVGSSVYTANFTPPSTPLTNITNTSLLCCQSTTSSTAAAVGTITATGTEASAFNPFTDDINTVMGKETGYCTLNPLGSAGALSDGNLVQDGGAGTYYATSTMSFSSGKWYAEFALSDHSYPGIGVCSEAKPSAGWMATQAPYYFIYDNSSVLNNYPGGAEHFSSLPTTLFSPGIFKIALDVDNGKAWIGYEGVWYSDQWATTGNPETGANPTFILPSSYVSPMSPPKEWFFFLYSNDATWTANFGQKPLKYVPPEGFQPPNYANLPSPGVVRPDQYVGVAPYTSGNGSAVSVNSYNFAPDLIFIKDRDGNNNWAIFDKVRGYALRLDCSATGGEQDWSDYFGSFDPNGFTVKAATSDLNRSTNKICSWGWKAGGDKNTFNVDDRGYATAAEVNMSVGSLNSGVYNQDEAWSQGTSASAAFDGDFFSTGFNPVDINFKTLTTKPFTVVSQIGVWLRDFGPAFTIYIEYNGVEYSAPGTISDWTYFDVPASTNTLLRIKCSASSDECRAVSVDGVVLVDNGVTPPSLPSIAPSAATVGTKQGFSIIKYTGAGSGSSSLPHGLLKSPDFIITKDLDSSSGWWAVYNSGLRADKAGYLNDEQAFGTHTFWAGVEPGSQTTGVYSIGANANTNSGNNFISYIWHNVPGLQKFGSYQGNDIDNGPFIYLGFRPAIVMFKNATTASTEWIIVDSKRDPDNVVNHILNPNNSTADDTSTNLVDFLSNGFKLRSATSRANEASNNVMIYAAWAHQPMNNLYGAESNAR